MVKRKAAIFFGFILFLYFFVVYDVSFYGPDAPIYFAYTSSIIDDGDLNVVNQCYPPFQKINISKTHNLPDFHNHGGIIFWSPFYVYGKIISYIAGNFNFLKIFDDSEMIFMGVMAFSDIAFGFFAIIFTYLLCCAFFSARVSILALLQNTLFCDFCKNAPLILLGFLHRESSKIEFRNSPIFSTAMIFLGTPYIVNNSRNADNLKNSGFFKNAEIVDSRYFEERENVGFLYEMAWYFKVIGKDDKAAEIKKHIREIYDGKR